MYNPTEVFVKMVLGVWIVMLIFLGLFLAPWKEIEWGTLKWGAEKTITVSGMAEKKTKNQIANFSAGVSAIDLNRENAVTEVNKKMDELVTTLKNFGIKTEDIQTAYLNIYQNQDSYWDQSDQRNKTRPGAWNVSNSVSIVLRDVDRASSLTDLLSKSGATNVYGPNFSLDKTGKDIENELYQLAIKDARQKAEEMVKSSGARLGEVLNIQEGGSYSPIYPMYKMMGGGGGIGSGENAPIEAGSSLISRSVTVTYRVL